MKLNTSDDSIITICDVIAVLLHMQGWRVSAVNLVAPPPPLPPITLEVKLESGGKCDIEFAMRRETLQWCVCVCVWLLKDAASWLFHYLAFTQLLLLF